MAITLQISIDALNMGVRDSTWGFTTPDGESHQLRTKVLVLQDGHTGISVEAILAMDAPPGVPEDQLPEGFKPPVAALIDLLQKEWSDQPVNGDQPDAPNIAIARAVPPSQEQLAAMNREQRRAHGARGQRPKR